MGTWSSVSERAPLAKKEKSMKLKSRVASLVTLCVLISSMTAPASAQQQKKHAARPAPAAATQAPDEKQLGSGLIDYNQKMTAAAIQMADMKVCAHRS